MMTFTNGNALDAEIIQEIMNQPGSAKEKIDYMKGYIDGTHPIRYSPDETLSICGMSADLTVWSSKSPNRYYQFLTAKQGERTLHGIFEEYRDGHTIYRAQYNKGVIQWSHENYPSGNVHVHNQFIQGCLSCEQKYDDDPERFINQQFYESRTTGMNDTGEGSTSTFHYNPDDTVCYQSYVPTFDGLNHGIAKYYYPSGALRATEEYYFGQENGNWYGYYEDGVPKYFQQWQEGVLVLEHTWYRSGHLRQSLIEGFEFNYNIPSEMQEDQDEPELFQNSELLTVEKANETIEAMEDGEGITKLWEDILNQAVRYGLRTICLDCVRSTEERDYKLSRAKQQFVGRGFNVYELPISIDPIFLSYICINVPI
ncbi:MAG: hypothetical protein ABI340_05470 [Nitrososphaera sp.]